METSSIPMYAIKLLLSNNSKHSLEEKNRENITKLKFIGTFQPGEKIDVRNLRIENSSIVTPIKRMFFGESRDTTYSFLNNTIDRTFEIISANCNSERLSEKLLCKNIINDLIKSVVGLKNIQKTYDDDKLFHCNIETIIESIQSKLSELKQKYPDIFKLETFQEEEQSKQAVQEQPKQQVQEQPKSEENTPSNKKNK